MKTNLIAATVIAMAAMSGANAFAAPRSGNAGVYMPTPYGATSTVTRAQVQQDTMQARQQSALHSSSDSAAIRSADTAGTQPVAVSAVSRSEVRAQTSQWAMSNHNNSDSDRKLSSQ